MANEILVIGGGPGGYVAAIRAAQLGAKVTLVEKDEIGGTCLNRGCIPTKALLHSSEVYEECKNSANIGINAENVTVDWGKVQEYSANTTKKLNGGVKALLRMNKVDVISGEAAFTGPKTVKVGDKTLSMDKIIIAAGSYPIVPPIPGVRESAACIDSTACLKLETIPKSMLIIGGGVIGIELGSVYARFGTEVTIVEMLPKLLPLMDGELASLVRHQMQASGVEIYTDSKVLSVSDSSDGAVVKVACPEGEREFTAEKVLVCIGRGPDTKGLGLENAGIKTDKRGFITVDDRMETNVPGVYAIGDCNGRLMLAHTASAMGEVAAENAMGKDAKFDPATCPSCLYVSPELAGVGLTEEKAKEIGLDYKVGKFPISANGKSMIMGCTDGMVKVIAGAKYGEIIGVHILAPRASDLIHEACLAIKLEATVDEFIDTIHGHPTVAESVREAMLAVEKRAIHTKN